MPYITPKRRDRVDGGEAPADLGELNYKITMLIQEYLRDPVRGLRYTTVAGITGVLENVKQEFYRRVVAPYEDEKIKQNGDVYPKSNDLMADYFAAQPVGFEGNTSDRDLQYSQTPEIKPVPSWVPLNDIGG